MSLFVLGVLLLHRGNELTNECAHLLLKIARQFVDKFHAVAPSCLLIAFLKIIFYVLVRFALILLNVLLSDGDVGDYKDLEETFQVDFNKVLVLVDRSTLTDVAHYRKDESLALSSS